MTASSCVHCARSTPSRRAPALHCAECGRHLAARANHRLLPTTDDIPLDAPVDELRRHVSVDRLLCVHCTLNRRLHAKYHPDCRERWHDLYDHRGLNATRAAAAILLGLWPTRVTRAAAAAATPSTAATAPADAHTRAGARHSGASRRTGPDDSRSQP